MKSWSCHLVEVLTGSKRVVWTYSILFHSSWRSLSQFQLKRLGPFPPATTRTSFLIAILDLYVKLTHDHHWLIHVNLEDEGRFPQLQIWEQGSSGLVRYDGGGGFCVQFYLQFLVVDYLTGTIDYLTGTMMGSDEWSVIMNSWYSSPLLTSLSNVVDSTSCMRCLLRGLVHQRLSCPVGAVGLEDGCRDFALEQHTDDMWPYFPQWLHIASLHLQSVGVCKMCPQQ